jgi:hypothetical protein
MVAGSPESTPAMVAASRKRRAMVAGVPVSASYGCRELESFIAMVAGSFLGPAMVAASCKFRHGLWLPQVSKSELWFLKCASYGCRQ